MKIVVIGAGGQARVVYEILSHDKNMEIVAFVNNMVREPGENIMGIPILGDHSVLRSFVKEDVKGFIVAVGNNKIRAQHFNETCSLGLKPINAVHPSAHIAFNAKIGKGVVVAIGAIITTEAKIGNNTIINTGAIIEHEDIVEDHVHIGPGTCLAGRVTVKKGTFIGMGCAVKDHITIGENVTIGAGSVVLEDIPDNAVAVGSPARVVKIKNGEDDKKWAKVH